MSQTVEQIVEALEQRIMESREALEEARTMFKALEAEERRLLGALKTLKPDSPLVVQSNGKGSVRRKNRKYISKEMIERVYEHMLEHSDREFSTTDLANDLSISDPTVRLAISRLREQNRVRIVRRDEKSGGLRFGVI